MNQTCRLLSLIVAVTSLSQNLLVAQERKVSRSALPAAVEKALQHELKGATVKGFATEVKRGKKVYEAETVLNGHTRDLQFAADGTLNEIEEEVALDSLPEGVKKALQSKAGIAKITKVESLTKHDRLVAYEATTLAGSRKGEIQVGPSGETLKRAQ